MKKKESNATLLQKVLRVFALLAVIFAGILLFMLLFSFIPMLFLDNRLVIESGGILDSVLRPMQHGSVDLPSKLIFLAALPIQTTGLFAFCWMLMLDLFVKRCAKAGKWLFDGGRRPLLWMTVFAALLAVVPKVCSVVTASAVAADGSYQTIPWSPLGGIVIFAVTLAAFIVYTVLLNRKEANLQEMPGTEDSEETQA